jgi:hypothetical protein
MQAVTIKIKDNDVFCCGSDVAEAFWVLEGVGDNVLLKLPR